MADPKFCPEILFTNVSATSEPNIYTATFTGTSSDISKIVAGMWSANTSFAHAFKINTISHVSSTEINVVLEDVNGYNATNDPSGNGGGPANDTNGYVFNLTQTGLNAFSLITSTQNLAWGGLLIVRFASIYSSTNEIDEAPILIPPICMEVLFTNILPTDNVNIYTATIIRY